MEVIMRITQRDLERAVAKLNVLTANSITAYTRKDNDYKANIGNYHIDYGYNRVSLVQIVNTGGGVSVILPGGTKAELYYQTQAFIAGIELGRKGH
jgi:hypothetical protein